MRKKIISCLALFSSAFTLQPSDQSTIEKMLQVHVDAWNLRGCKGFADGYADDATFVNIFGMKFEGKEEIEQRHIHILQNFMKDSKYEILETTLKEVQPSLVIVTEKWRVVGFRTPKMDLTKPGETREGIFTHVFLEQNGKWQIIASQNTVKP